MSSNELQALISPKFTEDVLLDILRKESDLQNVKIKKIVIDQMTNKGDSYLSTLCKFKVCASGKNSKNEDQDFECPVITKSLIKNPGRRATFRSKDFFENEIIFFEKVWPAFQKFQNSKNINGKFDEIPKMLSTFHGENDDYIALEDLSYKNFRPMPRSSGLDFDLTLTILKLFAHFHGLSLAFKDQNKEEFEAAVFSLKETYFARKFFGWYGNFQQSLIRIARDSIEKELDASYLKKFNALVEGDFYYRICDECEPRGEFSVVTHGDAWLPNFLFNFNADNVPEKTIMIDFQLTRYASLANDLLFFLYACVDPDVLYKQWDNIVEEYYKALVKSVEIFGSKNLITLEDLRKEIKSSMTFGIGMSMEAIVMSLADDDDVCDLDVIQGEDAVPLESVWVMHPFKQQYKRKRMAAMIKHAVDYKLI